MKILLDTHIILWSLTSLEKLPVEMGTFPTIRFFLPKLDQTELVSGRNSPAGLSGSRPRKIEIMDCSHLKFARCCGRRKERERSRLPRTLPLAGKK